MPLDAADILHLTGITLALSSHARDAVFLAVSRAKDVGATVSFDVNHRPSLWRDRDAASLYREITQSSDILFAGVDEASLLVAGGKNPSEQARMISMLGPTEVIIKMGAEGAFGLIHGIPVAAAPMVVDVVDTVGAGDAFVAGYLSARGVTGDAEVWMNRAVTAGALACTHAGDWEGAPVAEEFDHRTDRDAVQR